jgi:hypothetical protein
MSASVAKSRKRVADNLVFMIFFCCFSEEPPDVWLGCRSCGNAVCGIFQANLHIMLDSEGYFAKYRYRWRKIS